MLDLESRTSLIYDNSIEYKIKPIIKKWKLTFLFLTFRAIISTSSSDFYFFNYCFTINTIITNMIMY
jgi:hypothetical protein